MKETKTKIIEIMPTIILIWSSFVYLKVNVPNKIPTIDAGIISLLLQKILKKNKPSYLRITGEPGLKPVPLNNLVDEESLTYEISTGTKLLVLTTGSVSSFVYQAYNLLDSNLKEEVGIYGVNKITPLNVDFLKGKLKEAQSILVIEEGVENGFFSQFVLNYREFAQKSIPICHPKEYLECGTYRHMLQQANLDQESILNIFKRLLE